MENLSHKPTFKTIEPKKKLALYAFCFVALILLATLSDLILGDLSTQQQEIIGIPITGLTIACLALGSYGFSNPKRKANNN